MNQHTFQRLYAAGQRDFRYADLRGLSLKDLDLAGADFTEAKIQGTNFRGANLTGANFCLAKAGLHSGYIVLAIASSILGGAIVAVTSLILFVHLLLVSERGHWALLALIELGFVYYLLVSRRTRKHNILHNPCEILKIFAIYIVTLIILITLLLGVGFYGLNVMVLIPIVTLMIAMLLLAPILIIFLAYLLCQDSVQIAIAIFGEQRGRYFSTIPIAIPSIAAVIIGITIAHNSVIPHISIPTVWIGYGCAIAIIGGGCWLMLLLALSQTRRSLHRPITQLSTSPTLIPWAYLGTTSFQQANLTKANFTGAFLIGSNFTQAHLTDIQWGNAKGTTLACGLRYSPASPQS